MQVTFSALIKEIKTKSLVSLDKEARLVLQFLPDNQTLNKLNQLHKPDQLITVTIKEEEN